MLRAPIIASFGGCMTATDQNVSAPLAPRMAMATARANAPALFGPVPSTATLWYGVVGVDNVARSLQATRLDGVWLDAGDVPLPAGALLFATGPGARGWMVANMGATSKVFDAGGEPVGRVP